MKETFDDVTRNENIPLSTVKPSNVDQLIIDHHQISSGLDSLYDFPDNPTEEDTDDGFEDELSDSHQEKIRYKIEQLNAQFAADPTPVESNRQRHVTFKENLVDIMDSNSPQHSPDLLGDEDINEKSLELIQMLSQKPLFEELSSPVRNSQEQINFDKDFTELESEAEYSPVNKETEPVGILELETPELKEKDDSNEDDNSKCEVENENGDNDRSETFDEVERCSEILYSEKDADVNKLSNDEIDSKAEMMSVNRDADENISAETSHKLNIDQLQSDNSCIEAESNNIINESNLSSSNCHVSENTDCILQSNLDSNADELVVEEPLCTEINQNNIYSVLEDNETENAGDILEQFDGLEQNNDNYDHALSENCAPISNNNNVSSDDMIPDENSVSENNDINVEDTNNEADEEKILATEESSNLTKEFNEQIYSKQPVVGNTSTGAKISNSSTMSAKLRSSSKVKSVNSIQYQPNKKLPNYKGNPRSQYGLSKEECKDLMRLRKEKLSQMKMKEKEEEESRKQKQEEAQKAFAAWLAKKKMQEKSKPKKITKAASLKEVPTKEEHKKEYGDAEEAFQSWLKKKEKQISREEILKQLEEEEKALNQCRASRQEATKAFNKWLIRKQKDQNQLGKRATPHSNYLNSLPLQNRHIEAFAQTFHAYLGNTM